MIESRPRGYISEKKGYIKEALQKHKLKRSIESLKKADNKEAFHESLFNFARAAAPYFDFDFDRDFLPHLDDPHFWRADYIPTDEGGIQLRDSKSLGMSKKDAFKCLIDFERTWAFAQGIKDTVTHLKKENQGKRLVGIEPGPGTGILSILAAVYGMDEMHGVEINTDTFQSTKNLLKACGMDKNIHLYNDDATTVKLPHIQGAKLYISENLSSGYFDEDQFGMLKNLSASLAPDAEIIPYGGRISLALGHGEFGDLKDGGVNMIPDFEQVSDAYAYKFVESTVGMDEPDFRAAGTIPLYSGKKANCLLVISDFLISRVGRRWLPSGRGRFVGERWTLFGGKEIEGPAVDVFIDYQAGDKIELLNVRAEKNGNNLSMVLNGPNAAPRTLSETRQSI